MLKKILLSFNLAYLIVALGRTTELDFKPARRNLTAQITDSAVMASIQGVSKAH